MAPIGSALTLTALGGLPEIAPGDDLASIMLGHSRALLRPGDHAVALIAQKVVSKAEGRTVALRDVQPGAAARELAARVDKDPRLVELILAESTAVIRTRPGVLIVEHRSGHILANAGIDTSNIVQRPGDPQVLLWPRDPDGSARQLALALSAALGRDIPVIITDSMGRAWRNGVVGHAIGCYGLRSLWDRVGERDRCGNRLRVTQVASADALAASAVLLQGEGAEGLPLVWAQGLPIRASRHATAECLLRDPRQDLFR